MNLAHLDILIIASHIDIVTQNGNASIDAGLQPSNGISVEVFAIDVDSLNSVFDMVHPVQLLIGKVYGHSM